MSSLHIPLTLLDPDGGWVNAPLHVHELHGRPALLHFWSRNDAACRRELQQLLGWVEPLLPRGLQLVGVHVPMTRGEKLDTNAIEAAARELGLRYPIAVDDGSLAQSYGVDALPAYLVFDADGWLRHRMCGTHASDDVHPVLEHLEPLLEHHGDGHLDSTAAP
jgi:hypothetical protein